MTLMDFHPHLKWNHMNDYISDIYRYLRWVSNIFEPLIQSSGRPGTAWAPHIVLPPCRWQQRAVRAWHRDAWQPQSSQRERERVASFLAALAKNKCFIVKIHSPMGPMILLSFFDGVFGWFLFDENFKGWKWDGRMKWAFKRPGTITLSIPQRKRSSSGVLAVSPWNGKENLRIPHHDHL